MKHKAMLVTLLAFAAAPAIYAADAADPNSPDTTYWPMFDGVRGGALREEFAYFADCALKGKRPAIGRPERSRKI